MDLNQALILPISGNGNHRHMQSLVGMRSAALIPPVIVHISVKMLFTRKESQQGRNMINCSSYVQNTIINIISNGELNEYPPLPRSTEEIGVFEK